MRKLRLLVMVALIGATVATTSMYATGGGWSETIYYESSWTYAVGDRRVDGCNPGNNINWGTTSEYKEVSGGTCDGDNYCHRCVYNYNNSTWYCDYLCPE